MRQRLTNAGLAGLAMVALWMLLTLIGGITWANASGLATVYLPIGAAVGLLHRFPQHRAAFAVGIVVGAIALVPFTDDTYLNGLLGGGANAVEAVVASVLLQRIRVHFTRGTDALNFLLATAAGAAVGALLGAGSVLISGSRDPLEAATTWLAADLLGMVVLAPPFYLTTRASLTPRRLAPSLVLLTFATYCTVLLAHTVAVTSDFWAFALWLPLLLLVLLVGMRFGVTILGYVQIPAVVALFATVDKAHYSLWYQRQALTIVVIIAMMWSVLQVSTLLVQLRSSSALVDHLLATSPLPTSILITRDGQHLVEQANEQLLRVLDTGRERLIDRSILTAIHPEDVALAEAALHSGAPAIVRPAARASAQRLLTMRSQGFEAQHGPLQLQRTVVTFEPMA